jgi:GAF domain-containing protein
MTEVSPLRQTAAAARWSHVGGEVDDRRDDMSVLEHDRLGLAELSLFAGFDRYDLDRVGSYQVCGTLRRAVYGWARCDGSAAMTEVVAPGDGTAAELVALRRREAALVGVLRAVADAPGGVEAVLFEVARCAAELCGGSMAIVFMFESDQVATYNFLQQPEGEGARRKTLRPDGETSALSEVLRDRVVVRFDDQSTVTDPRYLMSRAAAETFGFRSAAYVPVPTAGPALGLAVFKNVIEPFKDVDVSLLQAFAAQAANAVSAAQQRNDLEQRNREVAESLELQTATSEVLRLISEHPGDLQSVFNGILDRAIALCDADAGAVSLPSGDMNRVEFARGHRSDVFLGTEFPLASQRAERFKFDDFVAAAHDDPFWSGGVCLARLTLGDGDQAAHRQVGRHRSPGHRLVRSLRAQIGYPATSDRARSPGCR